MVNLIFTILVLACCGYAVMWGGSDGKLVAVMLVIAGLASFPAASMANAWTQTNLAVLTVDLSLLIGLFVIVFRTRSFWPIWVCGMHLASISTHLASALVTRLDPDLYFSMQSAWSLPELGVMVLGIMKDRQARKEINISL